MRGCANLLACAALSAQPVLAQTFNTDSVIALHRAGLSTASIVAKIKTSPCDYDTSTERLIALKQAGLNEDIIIAMLERCSGKPDAPVSGGTDDPRVRHAPGIYLWEDWQQPPALRLLRPTTIAGVKVTGNGSLLFPRIARATVPQSTAQVAAINPRPSFYFYFNPENAGVGGFGSAETHDVQSPSEFSLVRLHPVGGNREFRAGRVEAYVNNLGVDPKDTLPFTVADLGSGSFRVDLASPLPPGEYAFVLIGEGKYNSTRYRIFDFAVRAGVRVGTSATP